MWTHLCMCVWMFVDLCFVAAIVIVYEMFFVKTTTIKKQQQYAKVI